MSRSAGLPPGSGTRLERFASAFERLDARDYILFASRRDDPRDRTAARAAEALMGSAGRRTAIREAVAAFVDWAARAYSNRLTQTDTVLLYQSLADRADDRVNFAASVERAVVAIILWDELPPDDRAQLLGPWEAMAERAAAD